MKPLHRDFLPNDLSREMTLARVHGAVAVQARSTVEETRWLLACAEQSAGIRGVVGWLPIAEGDIAGELKRLGHPAKLKGLRHIVQSEPDDQFMLGAQFNRGIASMLGTELVYDILIMERQLPQAIQFVANHPLQVFVLDHVAKPKILARKLEPWRSNLARLAAHPNVFCKLSGMATEADWPTWCQQDLLPYLDAALHAFGPERLIAGSDWPVCLLASDYSRWWETLRAWTRQFHRTHQEMILGETAKGVYRL